MTNKQEQLPIASAEDVEFSEELADRDDKEAQERAEAADRRASEYEGSDAVGHAAPSGEVRDAGPSGIGYTQASFFARGSVPIGEVQRDVRRFGSFNLIGFPFRSLG